MDQGCPGVVAGRVHRVWATGLSLLIVRSGKGWRAVPMQRVLSLRVTGFGSGDCGINGLV